VYETDHQPAAESNVQPLVTELDDLVQYLIIELGIRGGEHLDNGRHIGTALQQPAADRLGERVRYSRSVGGTGEFECDERIALRQPQYRTDTVRGYQLGQQLAHRGV